MMMADAISDEELFELSLSNFLEWLDVLTMEPVELCDTWENYNVAWELVSDLNADGGFVVAAKCGYLTERQNQEVRAFLDSLNLIPKSLLVSATTAAANQEAMSHTCWARYRESALALLSVLESAAERNRAYFSRQQE
jgi:hypothetical protein